MGPLLHPHFSPFNKHRLLTGQLLPGPWAGTFLSVLSSHVLICLFLRAVMALGDPHSWTVTSPWRISMTTSEPYTKVSRGASRCRVSTTGFMCRRLRFPFRSGLPWGPSGLPLLPQLLRSESQRSRLLRLVPVAAVWVPRLNMFSKSCILQSHAHQLIMGRLLCSPETCLTGLGQYLSKLSVRRLVF